MVSIYIFSVVTITRRVTFYMVYYNSLFIGILFTRTDLDECDTLYNH